MSSGPGDGDDGKLSHEAAQEMSRLRSQLQEERSVSRRLVAERNTLRSQVCKVQSDLQAFRDKHEKTMMGMEVMCVQLGIAKQKEVRAERMEASLKTLQEVSQQLEANPQGRPDAAFEALRLGLSSVLSDAKQCNEKAPAAWTPEGRQMTQMTQMTPQKTAQVLAGSLAKPHWDGQYLSSPPKIQAEGNSSTPSARSGDAAAESEGEGDLLPPPPNSKCWEWPLSKPEKQERVAMIDAQLWRYEQTGLIEQVEMLQGLCAKHGITPSFEDDEVGSTASSESV